MSRRKGSAGKSMNDMTNLGLESVEARTVRGLYRRNPYLERRHAGLGRAHDLHAVAHLEPRRGRQILRRPVRLHDRRRACRSCRKNSAWGRSNMGLVGAASLFGILVGALTLGALSDYFGRKLMFIVEMVIFISSFAVSVATDFLVSTPSPGSSSSCSAWGWRSAATIHGPSGDFGEYPLLRARTAGARRLRLPGGRRVDRDGHRLSDPVAVSRNRRVAAHVCERHHSRCVRSRRRFFVTESSHWLAAVGRLPEAEEQIAGC